MKKSARIFSILFVILVMLILSGSAFSQPETNVQKPPELIISGATSEVENYNVYYGHLHNHTSVSDGTGTPDDAYNYAKNTAGLDFFSLSEHGSYIDSIEWTRIKTAADSYNQDGVFTSFWGFEWTHRTLGHVTIINTDDYCTASSVPTFGDLLSWTSTRDCAAFFNHPGRQNSSGQEFGQFTDTPSDKFVGMELWNKGDAFSRYYYNDGYYPDDGDLGFFDEAITRDWKIGAGGSEDNHSGDWGTVRDFRMAILASNLSRASLYEAMHNKRFFSTLDINIKMSFKINGSEMGSVVEGNVGQNIQVVLSDGDGEVFTNVELIKNGMVLNSWSPGTSDVTISETLSTSDGDYYYIKVTQPDGDEAISSPVFIEGGITNIPQVCAVSHPESGAHYTAAQTISITADATDSDGSVSQIEFFVDGSSIGTDNSFPFAINWTIPANGGYTITAKATDNFGVSTSSEPVDITVGVYTELVSSQISSGNDDVEESDAGAVYLTSTDIELVFDTYNTAGNQTVGLRFNDLGIPQGVTITSASIQFTVDEVSADTSNLSIFGHNIDDSPGFSAAAFNVSQRDKTIASVNWNAPAWNSESVSGVDQQTPDLSAIIQEIVNRPGFSASSAISLIITGTGTRTAEAYEGVPASAAILNVEYTSFQNTAPVFISNPAIETTAAQTISISADATDSDGSVSQIEFFVDGSSIGTDNSFPFAINWTIPANGGYTITAKATDNFGASTSSEPVDITVGVHTELVSSQISTGNDDVEESDSGAVYLTSTDIELVFDTYNTAGNQTVGLRFNDLGIPQGVIITSASIQFTVDEVSADSSNLSIFGHNIDDSPGFSAAAFNVSQRDKTTASVNWNAPAWDSASVSGVEQQTPDLSAIIQEIVNRPGFSASSAISLIITGTGTRTAEAYDGEPANAALLHVEYTAATVNNQPITQFSYSSYCLEFSFSDESTDNDGSVVSWFWDFGDGNTSSLQNPTHNYATDGDYTVILSVTDDGDLTDIISHNVTSTPLNRYYLDFDGDGFGDADNLQIACSLPVGYVADNTDCDDNNEFVNPTAIEICDDIDNNCDGEVDENVVFNTYFADTDKDGYGDAANFTQACFLPEGYVLDNSDCDDGDISINPAATEICDGFDNNCDGNIDEGVMITYYLDFDNDGYGDPATSLLGCSTPNGYVANDFDCDDNNVLVNPGATEVCDDGIDNNCDGNSDKNCDGCAYETINLTGFESGFDFWNDGGRDCEISSLYSYSGYSSIRIQGNFGKSSSTWTDNMNLSNYDELTINFMYYAVAMEQGEDFWLQISTDGGNSFTILEDYNSGVEFDNGEWNTGSVVVDYIALTSSTVIRFQCDASSIDNGQVYIDDVEISGCLNSSSNEVTMKSSDGEKIQISVAEEIETEFIPEYSLKIYPNPFNQEINISIDGSDNYEKAIVNLMDISGRIIYAEVYGNKRKITIRDLNLNPGAYFIRVQLGEFIKTEKLIKTK